MGKGSDKAIKSWWTSEGLGVATWTTTLAMARFDPRLRRGCPSSPLVSERVVVSRPVVPGEKGCLLPIHSHSSKPHGWNHDSRIMVLQKTSHKIEDHGKSSHFLKQIFELLNSWKTLSTSSPFGNMTTPSSTSALAPSYPDSTWAQGPFRVRIRCAAPSLWLRTLPRVFAEAQTSWRKAGWGFTIPFTNNGGYLNHRSKRRYARYAQFNKSRLGDGSCTWYVHDVHESYVIART